MTSPTRSQSGQARPTNVIVVALYLFFIAQVGRTLARVDAVPAIQGRLGWFLGLELAFLGLFTLALWRPGLPRLLLHLIFAVQSALIVALFALGPDLDFVTSLFIMTSYQAVTILTGRARWAWIIVFVVLTGGSSMVFLEPLRGLALGLIPQAAEIVVAAYISANQEVEAAQVRSQAMLAELQETNRQLELYASQVEELAAIEERNRLARQIHDSVSQTMFSILLNTRAAQLLLEKRPERVRPQLEQLQVLVQSALSKMRSLIAELRIKAD
jgi:signal transduction histidine kinase